MIKVGASFGVSPPQGLPAWNRISEGTTVRDSCETERAAKLVSHIIQSISAASHSDQHGLLGKLKHERWHMQGRSSKVLRRQTNLQQQAES